MKTALNWVKQNNNSSTNNRDMSHVDSSTIFDFNLLFPFEKLFRIPPSLLLRRNFCWSSLTDESFRLIRGWESFLFSLFLGRHTEMENVPLHLMLHHNNLIHNDFEKIYGTNFWRVNEIESGCVSPWVLIKSKNLFPVPTLLSSLFSRLSTEKGSKLLNIKNPTETKKRAPVSLSTTRRDGFDQSNSFIERRNTKLWCQQ